MTIILQVKITPHCSALARPNDVAEVFVENYKRYMNGDALQFPIDLERGY